MAVIYAALGWLTGLIYAANGPARADASWLLIALAAMLLLVWMRRPEPILIAAAALGVIRFQTAQGADTLAPWRNGDVVSLTGVIDAVPENRDTTTHVRLRVQSAWQNGQAASASGLVLIYAPPTFAGQFGDVIRASGPLSNPPELDRFSYADMLARSGIHSVMLRPRLTIIERSTSPPPLAALGDARAWAKTQIIGALPEPYAGLLNGILLGDERGISPEVRDDFAVTGAAHVVAISGYNMVVLGGLIGAVMRAVRAPRLPAALISIGLIAIYTLFVGAGAAVVRAAFMTSVAFFGGAIGRRVYVPTSLAFTVLVLSILDPLAPWDVGFQLSAFAVLGIALFSEPLQAGFTWAFANLPAALQPVAGLIRETVTVGVAAQAFTLPLSALYFGTISPALLIVNLAIAPVQPFIMLFGGAALAAAALVPAAAPVFFWACLLPLGWTVGIVRLFADVPAARLYPSGTAVALSFAGVILVALFSVRFPGGTKIALGWLRRRWLWMAMISGAIICSSLAMLLALSRPDGRLHIWFFDMSSSAVLIVTPNGNQIVIDGGRYPSRLLTAVGDRLPFHDRTIEMAILTQPDDTLLFGVGALYERYQAATVLVNGQLHGTTTLDAVRAALSRFPQRQAQAGAAWQLDTGVTLEVMAANTQISGASSQAQRDAGTLVLRLSYGQFSAMLTGDASQALQNELIDAGKLAPTVVVQVPRGGRGAALAENFAGAVFPQYAIFQGDRLAQQHQPSAEALDRFASARVLRTDTTGVIHIISDGRDTWAEAEGLPRR